ncbi:MAG: LPS export ABC transporter permease LptF [Deltaproteobacteria bacterium]|nr:LPS export ABC transporter permease LptF [Deltaproteobacteria bacterium]MBN2846428.1 LPS export ABC transporter permease LptF [Deltaproteobacteria bacterium]
MHKTINRYILREISLPFFMILFILTFVLLMGKILQLMDLMINKGVSLIAIMKLISYLMPSFFIITIPISLLIAILIGLGRLSGDNEITIMKSSGISLFQLLRPIASASFFAFLVTALMGFFLVPQGNFATKTLLFEIAKKKASIGIKEKVFNNDFAGLVLYADHIPAHGNYMENLFLSDSRISDEPITIIAKRGYLVSNPKSMTVTLRLENGSSYTMDPDFRVFKKMDFTTYDINLDVSAPIARSKNALEKDGKEMTLTELIQTMRDRNVKEKRRRELAIELNAKFTIPFSCLIFCILGIPLGIVKERSGKSRGFVIGLVVVVIYYVLQLGGESLAETGRLAPIIGSWAPNVILGSIGIIMFNMAAQERPVLPFEDKAKTLWRKWKEKIAAGSEGKYQ